MAMNWGLPWQNALDCKERATNGQYFEVELSLSMLFRGCRFTLVASLARSCPATHAPGRRDALRIRTVPGWDLYRSRSEFKGHPAEGTRGNWTPLEGITVTGKFIDAGKTSL